MGIGIQRALILVLVTGLLPACGGGGGGKGGSGGTVVVVPPPGSNHPPTVSMTVPGNGTSVAEGAMLTLEAEATDPDGGVARVEFFNGANSLGSDAAAPFSLPWAASGVGNHSLTAVATDSSGAMTTSAPILITVTAGPIVSSPPQGLLQGVCFTDTTHGWVVGENGGIWATADAGGTWSRQTIGTTWPLQRVQFLSNSLGWVVGGRGGIWKTTDGGGTWTAQSAGTTSFLTGLSFLDATNGWVIGSDNVILRTTDGGATWTSRSPSSTDSWSAVSFISPLKGWVGGGFEIVSTSDGGLTWTHTSTLFNSSGLEHFASLSDARFAGPNLGMMSGGWQGGVVVFITRDSGGTWTQTTAGEPAPSFQGIAFGDVDHWWAVGGSGIILATADAGMTWANQAIASFEDLTGVWFVSATTGWLVGSRGLVARTTDGGRTWIILTHGS